MPKFAETVSKLYSPFPSVLDFLEQLNKQVSLGVVPVDGEGSVYGTMTARRRPLKPFIVGIIPPDVSLNYIPVEAAGGKQQGVAANGIVMGSASWATGPGGEQKQFNGQFTSAELRQALYDGYVKNVGRAPSEATLALMYAQIRLETGRNPDAKNLSAPNFNLGSSHVTTSGSGHKTGRFLNDDPAQGEDPANPFTPPNDSYRYFVGVDHDRSSTAAKNDGRPFKVAFNAFKTLKEGAAFQTNILLMGWKGTQTATTIEEFIDATKPIPGPRYNPYLPESPTNNPSMKGRAGYFGAWDEQYTRAMQVHYDAYFEQFKDPIGSVPNTGDPDRPFVISSPNVSTESESDPVGARLGRNIRVADAERQRIAAAQVEELRRQVNVLRAMPPLLMLINPSEFVRRYESSHDDGSKSRTGNIVHKWMERPLAITSSGVTAGQYVVTADGSGGLNSALRTSSLSYMNLMSLVGIYRNNGVLFGKDGPDRGVPIVSCSVYIYYDQHIYIGSFDDFGVQDNSDKPHNMSYNFSFTTRYDLDLSDRNFVLDSAIGGPGLSTFGGPRDRFRGTSGIGF
jgi:hypothetical protein